MSDFFRLFKSKTTVNRKEDLHELKRLHVQENRQLQAMAAKKAAIEEEQFRKQELDVQVTWNIDVFLMFSLFGKQQLVLWLWIITF